MRHGSTPLMIVCSANLRHAPGIVLGAVCSCVSFVCLCTITTAWVLESLWRGAKLAISVANAQAAQLGMNSCLCDWDKLLRPCAL